MKYSMCNLAPTLALFGMFMEMLSFYLKNACKYAWLSELEAGAAAPWCAYCTSVYIILPVYKKIKQTANWNEDCCGKERFSNHGLQI